MKTLRQSGQAMTEFIVAIGLVMGVLFVAIAMLGKFNDVRNTTLMGARYVAWERTVWSDSDPAKNPGADPSSTEGWSATYGSAALKTTKLDTEIQHEFLQRFASANKTPISGSDRDDNALPNTRPPMWADHGGQELLGSQDDVRASSVESESPTTSLKQYTTASYGSVRATNGSTYSATMALPTRTLQSGTLSVAIAQNNDALKRLWPDFAGLTFTDTNALLTNTWLPDGSTSAKAVFAKAVPAANVEVVSSSLYKGMQKYAPEIGTTAQLEFGRIQQDVLPYDRLR